DPDPRRTPRGVRAVGMDGAAGDRDAHLAEGAQDGAALGGARRSGGEEGDEAVPEVGGGPGLRAPRPAHRTGPRACAARRGGDPRPDGSVPRPVPRRAGSLASRHAESRGAPERYCALPMGATGAGQRLRLLDDAVLRAAAVVPRTTSWGRTSSSVRGGRRLPSPTLSSARTADCAMSGTF